jgi:hypothetical protein
LGRALGPDPHDPARSGPSEHSTSTCSGRARRSPGRRRHPSACVSRQGPHPRPYKVRRRRPLRALLCLTLPLCAVAVGQTRAASRRRCWSPDSMHRSIAEASRRRHELRLVVLHVCWLSSLPEDHWKVARMTPPVRLQSTTANRPSSKSGASRRSPPVVSTSLRSPRSPLSVLRLGRAPSCLEPRQFETPRSSCRP